MQVGKVSGSLHQQHHYGEIAGPLVHLTTSALAFALHLLEIGNQDTQQLYHDRCRYVGHDTQSEDRGVRESAAAEDVHQIEQTVALHLILQVGKGVGVYARHGHKASQTIYQDDAQSVDNTLSELLYLEYILQGFD